MASLISVIICTYNRPGYLKKALASLVGQTLSKDLFEVLVVDNNSFGPETKLAAEEFSAKLNLKYIFEKRQGLSYARNRGGSEASGQYVAFLDDDALAAPDWLAQALAIIKRRQAAVFGGPVIPYYDTPKPKWLKDKYIFDPIADEARYLADNEFLFGSNLFIQKSLLKQVGEFKVNLGMRGNRIGLGEETEWQVRARQRGAKIYFCPDLKVRHIVPSIRMKFSYISKRYFLSALNSGYIFKPSRSQGKDFLNALFDIIVLIALPVLYLIRNRQRFPYWQNYYIERVLHRGKHLLWLAGDLFFNNKQINE